MTDTQTLTLALIQDARGAYKLTTRQLEQVLAATIGTTHSRKSGDPLVAAVEQLRRHLTDTLRARRQLDALDAAQDAQAPKAQGEQLPGGTRVTVPPPAPRPLPPTRRPEPADAL